LKGSGRGRGDAAGLWLRSAQAAARGRVRQIVADRRAPRRGADLPDDVGYFLPNLRVRMVFDVGANVGQSAREFLRRFPDAQVYAFEPTAEAFGRLQAALAGEARARTIHVGLADAPGDALMHVDPSVSGRSAIADDGNEAVTLTTVDVFCMERRIDHIDLLKVDTEGFDLRVLHGAASLLGRSAIGLVNVEAAIDPDNALHVPLAAMRDYLEPIGYRVFGFYDQMGEWIAEQPQLRRLNAVFVSEPVIAANTGTGRLSRAC
jgi:FkbM family methyltransferase